MSCSKQALSSSFFDNYILNFLFLYIFLFFVFRKWSQNWDFLVFNLVFANDTVLSYFFFFFFITDVYFFNSCSYCTQFHPTAELTMPVGIPTKEAKAEIETHPVTAKMKISAQCNSKPYKTFLYFLLINSFWLFLQRNNFLFHLYFSV